MFQCPYCLASFGNLEMCNEHIRKCDQRPKEEKPEQETKKKK